MVYLSCIVYASSFHTHGCCRRAPRIARSQSVSGLAVSHGTRVDTRTAAGTRQRPTSSKNKGHVGCGIFGRATSDRYVYVQHCPVQADADQNVVACTLQSLTTIVHVHALAYVHASVPLSDVKRVYVDVSDGGEKERIETLTDVCLIEWQTRDGHLPNAAVTSGPTLPTRYAVIGKVNVSLGNVQFKQWKLLSVASSCAAGDKAAPFQDGIPRGFACGYGAERRLTLPELKIMGTWARSILGRCTDMKRQKCCEWEVTVQVEQNAKEYEPCAVCLEPRASKVAFSCCSYDGVCVACALKLPTCPICKHSTASLPPLAFIKPYPIQPASVASAAAAAACL